jgi:hypothetical protein
MFKNKKIFLIPLTAGLIFGTLFSSSNVRAAAVFGDPWQFTKQFVIYPLVRAIANSLQSKLTNSISQQISGINSSTPSFITNWRNHLLDSQGRGNDIFRAVLADTKICSYMSKEVKSAFGADMFERTIAGSTIKNASGAVVYQNKTNVPGMQSLQSSGNCTLPDNFDVGSFKTDFRNGGWEAWDRLLEPQNNFFGIMSMALNEQSNQIETEKESTMNSAIAGNGFLASKLGKAVGDTSTSASGFPSGPTGCTDTLEGPSGGATGPANKITRCTFMGKDVTPGYLKAGGAGQAIGAKINQPEMAQEITDVVLGLFASVLQGTIQNLGNYLGQATYDGVASAVTYNEDQKQAGEDDSQINAVNQKTADMTKKSQTDCFKNKVKTCVEETSDIDTRAQCLADGSESCDFSSVLSPDDENISCVDACYNNNVEICTLDNVGSGLDYMFLNLVAPRCRTLIAQKCAEKCQ